MDMRHVEALSGCIDGLDIPASVTHIDAEVSNPLGEDEIARTTRAVICTLKRLSKALQQQRRFASDTSHELRNPLAGLRAELEQAQSHPEDVHLHETLQRALSAVDRLEAIIGDLLLLSRVEGVVPNGEAPVDLAQLVKAEVSRRSDRIPVQLWLVPGVRVKIVGIQIGRVLTNLLDNAQRHAERVVRVEVSHNGRIAELAVSDDGEGIAEADIERIFERFTRLDAGRRRDRSGTGLGLSIAREIAQAHDGTLHAGDSPIGGARFTLRLPLAALRDADGVKRPDQRLH
ncbi:sensor histidine kinase [Microbispora bryophytorum]|uniref:histidine kinase n=1 Tax=Microbispora bryophytorum subsp. camponoti TaxID=1677852 RepID=A0ABR8L9K6_9ACTN|nr:HAMP domain-containing sensor histidine kinase [Microbispora camponoti]MBD3146305.1 HAMP domain-containing histidine kinase [Microbispora camponoti]